ncbi:potassium-transporting ATPase subunit F [Arthrobacter sp. 2MCAF15]
MNADALMWLALLLAGLGLLGYLVAALIQPGKW